MRRLLSATLLAVATTAASVGSAAPEATLAPRYEPVESFRFFGRLDDWHSIDRDTLIVWVTPAEPYLVELSRGSPDLSSAQTIGVTSTLGKVYAKLDSVLVRGSDYPIQAIYKLSREEAHALRLA